MPISPELKLIPSIALKFTRAGLTFEILRDIASGRGRDLAEDAEKLIKEYERDFDISLSGLSNIPRGGIITFNHPNNDILLPAVLKLVTEVKKKYRKEVSIVTASEIMLSANLNEKKSLPGSGKFIKRLHGLYPKNIISSPTVKSRPDYLSGRAVAARKALRTLKSGNLVAIAPEGHTEINDNISPTHTFHEGAGALAIFASKMGLPIIPVTIWREEGIKTKINILVAEPFLVEEDDGKTAVTEIMRRIAENLPEHLKGPFKMS
jgi:hypothetical protein